MKTKTLIVLIAFLLTVLLCCSKDKEPSPFFDGLYLKYYEVFGNPQDPEGIFWTRDIKYTFKEKDDGNFHITQKVSTQRGKKLKEYIDPSYYPQVGDDLTVDRQGIVLKGQGRDSFNFMKGYPSFLWLPPNKREKGAEVIEKIMKVEGKIDWEGWEAWSVIGIARDFHYYDVNTGILVGFAGSPKQLKTILIDTNHKILKSSIKKNMKI